MLYYLFMTNNFLLFFSQSAGLELLEQEPLVDIVLVCCGGGGFLAGVTAAIRLSGNKRTKVYGVEHMICESHIVQLDLSLDHS